MMYGRSGENNGHWGSNKILSEGPKNIKSFKTKYKINFKFVIYAHSPLPKWLKMITK